MKWGKNELFARWFAQNHDTTFSPNYLTGRHPPTTLSPQAGYIRNQPRSLFGQKKAALFSNFNHRHFARTDILYNFVGPTNGAAPTASPSPNKGFDSKWRTDGTLILPTDKKTKIISA